MTTFQQGCRIKKITQTLELFKAAEENYGDELLVCKAHWADPRTGTALYKNILLLFIKYRAYHICTSNNQKFGHRLWPLTSGSWKENIFWEFSPLWLRNFHFYLGAPHKEAWTKQPKLHPGFTLGKLVQPSPGFSILRDSHIVLS